VGTLSVPASGLVYLEANSVIYSVEKHPDFGSLLNPVWLAAKAKAVEVVSSELVLLETLVGPLKKADKALADAYELLFLQPKRGFYRSPSPCCEKRPGFGLRQS
jgi:hypothetical protein